MNRTRYAYNTKYLHSAYCTLTLFQPQPQTNTPRFLLQAVLCERSMQTNTLSY
jgi:hypothetical protein